MNKQYLRGFVNKINEADGIIDVAIATDATVDRDGEVILPEGIQFANFMKNPVLLWAHDYRAEPIGKVLEIRREGSKVLFRPQFAINISERAKQIFNMYKEGFLNAFSIGFVPIERSDETFTKTELLEISAVPVPANPNALVMVRSAKGIDKDIVKGMTKYAKTTIPYKDLGIDSNLDTEWQSGKEVDAANVEKLVEMCTWYDKEKADEKTAYKLPHHRASDLKAVWRGVTAAMAALLGARGGVNIPEKDRKGVYDHLAKHYKEFEKTAPEFKLVEAQVLKDVDFETDQPIVVNILKVSEKQVEEIKTDLKKQLSDKKDKHEQRSPAGEVASLEDLMKDPDGVKRLLQVVAKSVSTALYAYKQLEKEKKS